MHHGRNSVYFIVSRHVSSRTAFNNSHLKRKCIIFSPQTFIKIGGSIGSPIFIAVRQKVFHQRSRLPIFWVIPLKPFYKSNGHRSIKKSIFSITFFGASPAWISGNIGIWRPDYQTASIVFLQSITRFISFNMSHFLN
ncbi:hypothetical protein D3C80_1790130 [compost metagenome]